MSQIDSKWNWVSLFDEFKWDVLEPTEIEIIILTESTGPKIFLLHETISRHIQDTDKHDIIPDIGIVINMTSFQI